MKNKNSDKAHYSRKAVPASVDNKYSRGKETESNIPQVDVAGFDEAYLNCLINKAKDSWVDLNDPDEWLRELRGKVD